MKRLHLTRKTHATYSLRDGYRYVASCENGVCTGVMALDGPEGNIVQFSNPEALSRYVGKTASQLLAMGFAFVVGSQATVLIDDNGHAWDEYPQDGIVMRIDERLNELERNITDCDIDDDTLVISGDLV